MLVNGAQQPTNGTATAVQYLSAQSAWPDRDLAYDAALKLVIRIDKELARGTRHYRDKAGRLLTRLDEVVRAILADDLLAEEV